MGGDLEVGGEGSAVSNGTLRVGGSLEVSGLQVSGPGFAQEMRLFLGGACPPGWVEASETMGKLLASRGVSEDAGSNKSKAGIDVQPPNYREYDTSRCGYDSFAGCSYAPVVTAPSSFLLLLCKHA